VPRVILVKARPRLARRFADRAAEFVEHCDVDRVESLDDAAEFLALERSTEWPNGRC